jgi:hypothetical protein
VKTYPRFLLAACLGLAQTTAWAQTPDGTWIFDKAVDYEGLNASPTPPPTTSLVIANGKLALSGNCVISLRLQNYYAGGPFQALLKSGEDESAIAGFLNREFSYRLAGTRHYYAADLSQACNTLGHDFLVSEQRLVLIRAGALFFGFTKSTTSGAPPAPSVQVDLQGLKASQLPFKVSEYLAKCAGKLTTVKGVPQATSKCAPAYQPYVASRQSRDKLSQLIGTHAYQTGGARNESEDYNDPVAHGLHPVFVVFPPLKEVVLVRVDDLERAEERDPIKGAYLAIKRGQVTDQLNASCGFDERYVCRDEDGKPKYQLTESGKFAKQP